MHFFDPTVDWPIELSNDEIPDLLFLKSTRRIDLDFSFPSPSLSGRFSDSAVWTEYSSTGHHAPYFNILLLQPKSIDDDDEDHVNALLDDIGSDSVEVAKYRKVACNNRYQDRYSEPAPYMQCWAWYTLGCGLHDERLSSGGSNTGRTMFKVISSTNRNAHWDPPPYLVLEQLKQEPFATLESGSPEFATANKIVLRVIAGSQEPVQLNSGPDAWPDVQRLLLRSESCDS